MRIHPTPPYIGQTVREMCDDFLFLEGGGSKEDREDIEPITKSGGRRI